MTFKKPLGTKFLCCKQSISLSCKQMQYIKCHAPIVCTNTHFSEPRSVTTTLTFLPDDRFFTEYTKLQFRGAPRGLTSSPQEPEKHPETCPFRETTTRAAQVHACICDTGDSTCVRGVCMIMCAQSTAVLTRLPRGHKSMWKAGTDAWGEGICGGWGKMEFQVAMRSDTEGRAAGSLLSAPRMLSLNASVPRHPARTSSNEDTAGPTRSVLVDFDGPMRNSTVPHRTILPTRGKQSKTGQNKHIKRGETGHTTPLQICGKRRKLCADAEGVCWGFVRLT